MTVLAEVSLVYAAVTGGICFAGVGSGRVTR
ncbi:hypothetical protein jaqu_01050 [Jannaschia aquimarina]|uniref:Uncharacterized protein n=1 Tax=Jannaschia aquimarina TaxID=935700 RepID=A0A0D1ER21_9RHOB|nr:hypothetical protein jaqu_01050 [Jannaschia aquimarina]SNT40629.1 hypothetical protein SAMN05421775_1161 [Jannaschia aquimarina]